MKKINAEDLEITLLEQDPKNILVYGIAKRWSSLKDHEGVVTCDFMKNTAIVNMDGDLPKISFEVSEFHLFAFEKPGQNYVALRRLIILYANAFWESLTWLKENDKEENRRERGDCEY